MSKTCTLNLKILMESQLRKVINKSSKLKEKELCLKEKNEDTTLCKNALKRISHKSLALI